MRILFFAGRLIYGGGEKVRNWLVGKLTDEGHEVVYATPKVTDDYFDKVKKVGLCNKVEVVEYPFHLKKKSPIEYYRAVKALFLDNHIDLLMIFGGSLVEQVIARKLGITIILSERCEPASRPIAGQILKQIQYRVADGYVFQTPEAAACYGSRAVRISKVIPNPIIDKLGEPQFDNLRKEVVSVGRLSNEKNQKDLVTAFSIFVKTHPDYCLKLYGSGPLKDELEKQIYDLGLNEKVQIISGKTNISELIKGAELFVLNSNTEGMPNALIEAMSMGLLSISTDCPIYGPRLLVEHGVNAYLTPLRDPVKLAGLMSEALEDSSKADSVRHEAIKIRERLEANKIFSQWLNYIETIV